MHVSLLASVEYVFLYRKLINLIENTCYNRKSITCNSLISQLVNNYRTHCTSVFTNSCPWEQHTTWNENSQSNGRRHATTRKMDQNEADANKIESTA